MKMKLMKSVMSLIMAVALLFGAGVETNAAELSKQNDDDCFIINGNIKVPMYTDYYNPETGEYLRWKDTVDSKGTIAKTFEFRIRYSVTSAKFTISSTSVYVDSSAWYENAAGNPVSGGDGHRYTIDVFATFVGDSLQCDIGGTESGTLTGFTSGNQYRVRITNNDALPYSTYYLVGVGTITNM